VMRILNTQRRPFPPLVLFISFACAHILRPPPATRQVDSRRGCNTRTDSWARQHESDCGVNAVMFDPHQRDLTDLAGPRLGWLAQSPVCRVTCLLGTVGRFIQFHLPANPFARARFVLELRGILTLLIEVGYVLFWCVHRRLNRHPG
jgi:hypothetical protein